MAVKMTPTKGNLMSAKNTLRLSRQGYEMLDKKRNILIREMMLLIDEAKAVESKIKETFHSAYIALENANIMMGLNAVSDFAHSAAIEDSISLTLRSVMGVEIPVVHMEKSAPQPLYSFYSTTSALDEAKIGFERVKVLSVRMAEIENAVYRLAQSIKKTQKRANALSNITIPRYEALTKEIAAALEEKEREEHTRLKIIKHQNKKGD